MTPPLPLKIIGSVAIVGAIAALAVLNRTPSSLPAASNFAEDLNQKSSVLFNQFLSKHHKNYLTRHEYEARLENFKNALQEIEDHNARNKDFKLALNKFADLSDDEFRQVATGLDLNGYDPKKVLEESIKIDQGTTDVDKEIKLHAP